jgi:hypothetical protein
MQERLRAEAHPDRLGVRYAKCVENGEDIVGAAGKGERSAWIRRATVTASVRDDDAEPLSQLVKVKKVLPVGAGTARIGMMNAGIGKVNTDRRCSRAP